MRRVLIASVAALAAAVAVGVCALFQEVPLARRRLPDGGMLTLRSVTCGTRHEFVEQQLWQRLLGPVLPDTLQGRSEGWCATSNPTLAVWPLWTGPRPADGRRRRWPGRLEVVDEHGCAIVTQGYCLPVDGDGDPQVDLIPAYPRRQPTFGVRVYDAAAGRAVAEFTLSSPAWGRYPAWQPQPFPTAKRSRELSVTLFGLGTGVRWEQLLRAQPAIHPRDLYATRTAFTLLGSPSFPATAQVPWTRIPFEIREDGQPCRRWVPAGLVLSDATGNRLDLSFPGFHFVRSKVAADGKRWMAFPAGLCFRESAWKLRMDLIRAQEQDVGRPDLVWTVRKVPLPARPKTVNGIAVAVRNEVILSLDAAGPGVMPPWPHRRGSFTRLHVTARLKRANLFNMALRVTDHRGRRVPCSGGWCTYTDDQKEFEYNLPAPLDARSVDLTFYGWKGRRLEFLVSPSGRGLPATGVP